MLDDELADIVGDLRRLGGDDADVEAKRAEDRLPQSVRTRSPRSPIRVVEC